MLGTCTIMDTSHPECTMEISKSICTGFHVSLIMGDHNYNVIVIGYILVVIYKHQSEAMIGIELDATYDEQINNSLVTHSFFLCLIS